MGASHFTSEKCELLKRSPFATTSQSPASASWACGGRAYKAVWTGWEPCLMQTCPLSLCGSWGAQRWSSAVSTEPWDPLVGRPASAGTVECGAKGPGCGTGRQRCEPQLQDRGFISLNRYFPNYKIPTGAALQASCMLYIKQGLKGIL